MCPDLLNQAYSAYETNVTFRITSNKCCCTDLDAIGPIRASDVLPK